MKTKIEWADKVWNPVTGCTKISEGCRNCYAERWALTMLKNNSKYKNGFAVTCHEDSLEEPFRWKKPSRIFVCSMGDLFHEDVPFHFIDGIFEIMIYLRRHIFLILTKRPKRVLEYYNSTTIFDACGQWEHIWIGVSCENQATAQERISVLLTIPASHRFVSLEPLLGPVNLNNIKVKNVFTSALSRGVLISEKLDWVIVGGESGPGARPMHPKWANDIAHDCRSAKVPFFFKQWGSWAPIYYVGHDHKGGISNLINPVPDGKKEILLRDPPINMIRLNKELSEKINYKPWHREIPVIE